MWERPLTAEQQGASCNIHSNSTLFFSPSHHYFFCISPCSLLLILKRTAASRPLLPLPALFWCPYKYLQAIHPLAYLLNWVRLHTLKPRVPPGPQKSSFTSIMRPHRGTDLVTYITPAITIVLIRFHLFLLKHVWSPQCMIIERCSGSFNLIAHNWALLFFFNHIALIGTDPHSNNLSVLCYVISCRSLGFHQAVKGYWVHTRQKLNWSVGTC